MDRFGESARKGFDFLKSRAKETVEVTKLNSSIRDLEERRDQCLRDIGHRVMAMFDSPVFDREALRDRVEEVRKLNTELDATEKEYEDVKTSLKSSVEDILPTGRRESTAEPSAADSAPPPPPAPAGGVTPPPPSYE
jgi:hypothetical protein